MPFGQRKRIIEKARTKPKRPKLGESGKAISDITVGSQVCLRSSPIYHIGAVAFTTSDGVPKVGQLMKAAWSLNDSCHFKVKTCTR